MYDTGSKIGAMTLSTDILITGPVSQDDVFAEANRLLGIPDRRIVHDETEGDIRTLRNGIGQGFPAIVDTTARADGDLMEPTGHDTGEWACESTCTYWRHVSPAFHIDLDLDTAYGYRDEDGNDCNTLHARVIVGLHKWLAERGGSLRWVNEYSGEISDGVAGLDRFIAHGDQAQGWFVNDVAPLLAAMGADVS